MCGDRDHNLVLNIHNMNPQCRGNDFVDGLRIDSVAKENQAVQFVNESFDVVRQARQRVPTVDLCREKLAVCRFAGKLRLVYSLTF